MALNYLYRTSFGNVITGVQVYFNSTDDKSFQYATLKRIKGSAKLIKSGNGISSIDNLKENIESAIGVLLSIDGRIVIHRKISFIEGYTDHDYLKKEFPGSDIKDFYIQLSGSGEVLFLSIVRKQQADLLIEDFFRNGFTILDFCLGAFILEEIIPSGIFKTETIEVFNGNIQLDEKQILNFSFDSTIGEGSVTKIDNEIISSSVLIPFIHGLLYFLNFKTHITTDKITEKREEFLYRNKFQFAGIAAMVFFLLILLINFMVFNTTEKQIADYQSQIIINESVLADYENKKNELTEKKEFFNKNGLLQNVRVSFYLDKIAMSVPAEITLRELTVNPIKNDDPNEMIFENGTILLTGRCKNTVPLNSWITNLTKNSWIHEINDQSYYFDSEENSGTFRFKLKI